MKRLVLFLVCSCVVYGQVREGPPKEPRAVGQAALTARFHKDEVAFKAVANRPVVMKNDEFALRMCYGASGMSMVPRFYASYLTPGCTEYFDALEHDLAAVVKKP